MAQIAEMDLTLQEKIAETVLGSSLTVASRSMKQRLALRRAWPTR